MNQSELRVAAIKHAAKALAKLDRRKPSQASVKKVANQVVKLFEPVAQKT
jgi:hypothetical protein